MLRAITAIYSLGIVVVFLLQLFLRPGMPLLDAVLYALVWPYGVYLLIVDKVDVTIKSGLVPAGSSGAFACLVGCRLAPP